ncbi:MAG TPA: hypothetical protein VGW35_21690 [Methylomirabilota bacterium]|jgi:hypothetical protein|nr:hypothetical protein [Methylomirabilota bacterium]
MADEILPWFTALLLALAVGLILVIATVFLPRTMRVWTTTRRFYCPWRGRNVVVRYLTVDGREAMCVMSCTAFADPSVPTCGMPCLDRVGARQHIVKPPLTLSV